MVHKNVARNIALILTAVSIIFTAILIFQFRTYLRLKQNGKEINTTVVEVIYDHSENPPVRIYKMEFIGRDGKKWTKDYANTPFRIDKFKIGQSVPMLINYNEYDDFWYYPDFKERFCITIIVSLGIYVFTLVCWNFQKRIQMGFEKGYFKLGD
jgi:hypothetical protein